MTKKKTHEEFEAEVFNLVGNDYKILSEYIKSNQKLLMKHNICGYEYDVAPSKFLNGRRCPKCGGTMKKTHNDFVSEVFDLVSDEFEVIGQYKTALTKIKMFHKECGKEFEVVPSAFLSGNRCTHCRYIKASKTMAKTTEQFKQELYVLVGDGYELLSEYVNSHTKIALKHNECGEIWETSPNNIIQGARCIYCYGNIKKTTEEFKKEVKYLVGEEYSVLGEYINGKTYIEMKHNECNYIYDVKPTNFISGRRCPNCNIIAIGDRKRKSHEQFVNEVFEILGNDYSVVSEYIKQEEKVKMKHNICGKTYETNPCNPLKGTGCPYCAGILNKTHEEFVKEVFELVSEEYSVLSEYINTHTKVKMKHNDCGYMYDVQPSNFLYGKRCANCYGNIQKTTEQIKKEIFDLVENEYTILGEYVNSNTKVQITHNKCGHIYDVNIRAFVRGNRCPKCNASKGETAIAQWLKAKDIYYEIQYKFDDCKYKKRLPFDLAIFKKDGSPFIIEFHGIQHYEIVDIFGGEKGFKSRQKRDKIKEQYCEKNYIPLLVIPYWDFDNIDQILEKAVLHLDLQKIENQENQLELIF
jgi:ssDNA-binding Zn-finger/Zn-ribbon topoisomerase 1